MQPFCSKTTWMTKLLREPAITLDNSGAALHKYQGLHVSGLFPLPEIKMVSPLWFVTEILRNFHGYIKVQPSSRSMLYILDHFLTPFLYISSHLHWERENFCCSSWFVVWMENHVVTYLGSLKSYSRSLENNIAHSHLHITSQLKKEF